MLYNLKIKYPNVATSASVIEMLFDLQYNVSKDIFETETLKYTGTYYFTCSISFCNYYFITTLNVLECSTCEFINFVIFNSSIVVLYIDICLQILSSTSNFFIRIIKIQIQ